MSLLAMHVTGHVYIGKEIKKFFRFLCLSFFLLELGSSIYKYISAAESASFCLNQ